VLEPLPLCVDIVERLTASKKVMEMQRNEARAKIRDLEAELLQKTQQLRCEHCGMKVDDAQ
jgi:DNA-directed RNA polymerase subunit RPC12/RpoP